MIIVYRYGMPARITLPDEVLEQLRLGHDLREDLVSLQLQREHDIAAVWSSYPRIAAIETNLAKAEAIAGELAAQLAAERGAQRTRNPATGTAADLKTVRATVRELKQDRRTTIATVRDDAAARITAISTDHQAAVKALYGDYVQTRGLYWGCYNRIVEQQRTAARRIAADRAAGHHGGLRHHRFDGSGALSVQLQRQRHEPQRSPALLASGTGRWRTVLQLEPWIPPHEFDRLPRAEQRRRGRGTVIFHVGRDSAVELPVIVHRMMPAEADVTTAQLVVRRVAGSHRVHLTVTARLPDPEPRPAAPLRLPRRPDRSAVRPTVALHFGWRRVEDDGTLKVATWRGDGALPVVPGVADVITTDTVTTNTVATNSVRTGSPSSGTIILPGTWRDAAQRSVALASRRDRDFDAIQAQVVDWLTANPANMPSSRHPASGPDWDPPSAADVARWHAPARLITWARRISSQAGSPPDPSLAALLGDIECWRRSDRHLWEQQTHGRDKALGRRDDAWAKVAAWLAATAAQIVLDDTNLTELSRTENTSVPKDVVAIAGRQRMDAAVGRLRERIRTTAQREGVPITVVSHLRLSRTHAECGHVNPADGRYHRSPTTQCEGCGQRYDPDANAATLMLSAAQPASDASRDRAH